MSSLSETMATNEKMRAWLERSIEELTSGDWLEATGKREEAIRLPQSDDSPECAVPSWPSDDARQHARARSPPGALWRSGQAGILICSANPHTSCGSRLLCCSPHALVDRMYRQG
jgi:hypothetical protein